MEPLGHNILLKTFRRFTPGLRSVDEHPLVQLDLAMIEHIFPGTRYSYHHYLTLLLLPVVILPGMGWLVTLIARLDTLLFRIFPRLQRRAWVVLMEFEKN